MNYKKIGLVLLIVGGLIWGGNKYIELTNGKTATNNPVAPSVSQVNNELQRIMDEENFKKATILRARKVASDNKMKAENNRHDQILAEIEKENEAIRTEELALVGTDSVSLK